MNLSTIFLAFSLFLDNILRGNKLCSHTGDPCDIFSGIMVVVNVADENDGRVVRGIFEFPGVDINYVAATGDSEAGVAAGGGIADLLEAIVEGIDDKEPPTGLTELGLFATLQLGSDSWAFRVATSCSKNPF